MSNYGEVLGTVLAIIAVLGAFGSAMSAMRGDLEGAVTPGWMEFALSYPTIFAIGAVVIVAVAGTSGVLFLDNI